MNRFLLLLIILFTSTLSYGQNNDSFKETVNNLLETTGAKASAVVAIDQIVIMFKQQKPEVPVEFWDEFVVTFKKAAENDLLELLLPIYQKHFTEQDLQAVISFYQTPVGKKFAENAGIVMQESMQAGQTWGSKVGEKLLENLKAKGY